MSQTAPEISKITDLEAAKLLLDEWKFRQQHGWSSLQRYGIAAVTVSIVPYLKLDLFAQLGGAILAFPIVGWLISLGAVWLFAAEYVRCWPVESSFQKLLESYYAIKAENKGWKRILERKVGWATIYLLSFGFTVLSVANCYILSILQSKFLQNTVQK